jgi:hypothetical protein
LITPEPRISRARFFRAFRAIATTCTALFVAQKNHRKGQSEIIAELLGGPFYQPSERFRSAAQSHRNKQLRGRRNGQLSPILNPAASGVTAPASPNPSLVHSAADGRNVSENLSIIQALRNPRFSEGLRSPVCEQY